MNDTNTAPEWRAIATYLLKMPAEIIMLLVMSLLSWKAYEAGEFFLVTLFFCSAVMLIDCLLLAVVIIYQNACVIYLKRKLIKQNSIDF